MADSKTITQAQLVRFAKKADARLDALEAKAEKAYNLTISADGWTEDSGDEDYPFKYVLAVEGMTAASRISVELDLASRNVAADCGVCAECETAADTVIFTSRTAPASDLTGWLFFKEVTVISG